VLSVSLDTVRVFLHVLAATVWVGGQLTLAFLVPALRATGEGVTKAAARAFDRVAWPAYAILLATGVWNLLDGIGDDPAYRRTLEVKVAVVVVSGATAFLHARAKTRGALAAFGALSGLSALAALFLGVMLG
jgi:putative copper export protein